MEQLQSQSQNQKQENEDQSSSREFFDENGKFPNCNDNPNLQEFFLQLLFSDGFDEFVSQVEEWLNNYRSKIDSYGCSQGKTEIEEL